MSKEILPDSCYFSDKLRALWKASGVTQQVLTDAIGGKLSTVRSWLGGASRPNYEDLIALAEYFNVTVDEMLRDLTPTERARLLLRLDLPVLVAHLDEAGGAMENARKAIDAIKNDLSPGATDQVQESGQAKRKKPKATSKKGKSKKRR